MKVTKKTANRIYLIGFMGSGKSTLGPMLAKSLDLDFVDLDDLIEEVEAMKISEIFERKGEQYFRNKEREILATTESYSNTVFATGGGLPCYNQNMKMIQKLGYSIYLELTPLQIFNRIKNSTNRPLVNRLSTVQLKQFIQDTLSKRVEYYNQAMTVVNAHQPIEKLVIECMIKIE